jgi:hypothetical protein
MHFLLEAWPAQLRQLTPQASSVLQGPHEEPAKHFSLVAQSALLVQPQKLALMQALLVPVGQTTQVAPQCPLSLQAVQVWLLHHWPEEQLVEQVPLSGQPSGALLHLPLQAGVQQVPVAVMQRAGAMHPGGQVVPHTGSVPQVRPVQSGWQPWH